MKKENFINENVYTFLLNELKKFEFDENDLKQVKKIVYSSLNSGGKFISNDLSDLKFLENLEFISLSNFIINRPNIAIIQNCQKVKEYDFNNCDFKDVLKIHGEKIELNNCKNSFKISLNEFNEILIQNESLKNISVNNCKILNLNNCTNIAEIENYDNVKELEISSSKISNIELEFIEKLQNCKIVLVECKYEDNILNVLRSLKNVKRIKQRLFCENVIDIEEE